jgi:hypothetical protein
VERRVWCPDHLMTVEFIGETFASDEIRRDGWVHEIDPIINQSNCYLFLEAFGKAAVIREIAIISRRFFGFERPDAVGKGVHDVQPLVFVYLLTGFGLIGFLTFGLGVFLSLAPGRFERMMFHFYGAGFSSTGV